MKYVYVKNRNTLDVARHEAEDTKEGWVIKIRGEKAGQATITKRIIFLDDLHPDLELLSYQEYRAIVNGKIQAQREILDQEYSRYQKAHYEAKKELRAKELPIDEVTE